MLLLTGTGQSVVNPTALAMSPDGLGLVIADLLPAGYSQVKYLNLSSSTVTTIGPNNVQSNCGNSSNTYQNGWIGGPACFGLIQQIITGTGTLGNQLLFFEVNTGRIRALDWSTQLMRTLIGGGPANNGFSAASNIPKGWAKGYGTESSLDRNLTGLVWDTTRNVGSRGAAGQLHTFIRHAAQPVSSTASLSATALPSCRAHSLTAMRACCVLISS